MSTEQASTEPWDVGMETEQESEETIGSSAGGQTARFADDVDDGQPTSRRRRRWSLKRKREPAKWFLKCPRFYALLLGVIVPLWLLIAVSFGFGYGLAVLEADPELDQNDLYLKNQAIAIFQSASFRSVTQRLPILCLERYVSERTIEQIANDLVFDLLPSSASDTIIKEDFAASSSSTLWTQNNSLLSDYLQSQANAALDMTQLLNFLQTCSSSAKQYVHDVVDRVTQTAGIIVSTSDLTFYWNRCPLKANTTSQNDLSFQGVLEDSVIFQGVSSAYRKNLQPSSQSRQYKDDWNKDAISLYFAQLNQTDLSKMNVTEAAAAKYDIFLTSIDQATGRDGCYPNTVASVWFWFTVMTTIGYGNQIPVTWQGRTMFFTVGFLNILLFGAIAAGAGYVLSSLANDFASRRGIPIESKPWIACTFWAILLYVWMLVIAFVYRNWKVSRLGEPFPLSEAYWFSYVSTTTVGLGDLSLDPEVLVASDLLTFPVLFLISFSFFGSFITDLGRALFKPFEDRQSLADVLKEHGILQTEESIRASKHAAAMQKAIAQMSLETSDEGEEEEEPPASAAETLITGTWKESPDGGPMIEGDPSNKE